MILPKTTVEQRSRFHEDVEVLLSPGFLTHSVVIAGTRLQVRSLGSGDLFMLRARTDGCTSQDWRVWAIATSIWMVNGRSVLGQDDAVPFLAEYVRQMPKVMQGVLFTTLLGLWARVGQAISAVEVFIYETHSRYKWKSLSNQLLNSGVPGAAGLGLNTVQRIWTAFNEVEDSRQADETAWEGFKLVASASAPKAVAKIDQRDHQRRRDELEQRQRRMDQFFYEKIGILSPAAETPEEGPSYRLSVKSVEDLEDEMRRWVVGQDDLHDQVVSQYKAQIQAQHEQEQAAREARRQALQAERDRIVATALEDDFKPQPTLALTGAQLQQMLQGRQGSGRSGVTYIPPDITADRVYSKYLEKGKLAAGQLQVQGRKVVDPTADPDVDVRTLNELIRSRNPAFGSGEE